MICPFCKEEIQDGAIKCKHCGSMIGAQPGKWVMEIWQTFVVAILLLFIFFLLPPLVNAIIVIVTSIWASYDAGKINAKGYQSKFMKPSPIMVFIGCLLLWIIVFNWYLYFRSQIKAGLAKPVEQSSRTANDMDIVNDSLKH